MTDKLLEAASAPTSAEDARDAARYRFIRGNRVHHWHSYEPLNECPTLDEAIDAAMRESARKDSHDAP